MTVGELARLFNAENNIDAKLQVIPMRGYQRTNWYDDTGLPWVAPSPNLRTLTQTVLYPGVAIVEGGQRQCRTGNRDAFRAAGRPLDKQCTACRLSQSAPDSGHTLHPN